MTDPSRSEVAPGKVTVLVSPRSRASAGAHDDVVWIDSVFLSAKPLAQSLSSARCVPTSPEFRASGHAVTVRTDSVEQPESPKVEHHLWHAAGKIGANGRMIGRAVGQDADESGNLRLIVVPVIDGGPRQARRECNGRDV